MFIAKMKHERASVVNILENQLSEKQTKLHVHWFLKPYEKKRNLGAFHAAEATRRPPKHARCLLRSTTQDTDPPLLATSCTQSRPGVRPRSAASIKQIRLDMTIIHVVQITAWSSLVFRLIIFVYEHLNHVWGSYSCAIPTPGEFG